MVATAPRWLAAALLTVMPFPAGAQEADADPEEIEADDVTPDPDADPGPPLPDPEPTPAPAPPAPAIDAGLAPVPTALAVAALVTSVLAGGALPGVLCGWCPLGALPVLGAVAAGAGLVHLFVRNQTSRRPQPLWLAAMIGVPAFAGLAGAALYFTLGAVVGGAQLVGFAARPNATDALGFVPAVLLWGLGIGAGGAGIALAAGSAVWVVLGPLGEEG